LVSGHLRSHYKVQHSWKKYLGGCDFYYAIHDYEKKESREIIWNLPVKNILYYRHGGSQVESMFFGIHKAWESLQSVKYDYVIRLRPDVWVYEDLRKWVKKGVICVPPPFVADQYRHYWLNDQVALGEYNVMQKYCSHTINLGCPHKTLAEKFNSNGLKAVRTPMKFLIVREWFPDFKDPKQLENFILKLNWGKESLWHSQIWETRKLGIRFL